MVNKIEYLKPIEHAVCIKGIKEASNLLAYKIDDDDGIAKDIGFHAGMVYKVDYFVDCFIENKFKVQLIELSDLKESIQNCRINIEKENKIQKEAKGADLTVRERKQIRIAAWKDIKIEFCKKWNGSIAIVERLLRKTNNLDDTDPIYTLLVVFKNDTDIKMLDELKLELSSQLSGMMGAINVCNTEMLGKALITKIE